jgi:hypothetical protein
MLAICLSFLVERKRYQRHSSFVEREMKAMMRTRIASWLNRTAQCGAMDIALQTTELNICAYDGPRGQPVLYGSGMR